LRPVNQTIRFAPYALLATLALAAACSSDDDTEAPPPHATGGIAGASGHTSVGGKATGGKASGGGGGSSNTGGTVAAAGSTSTGGAAVGSGGAATGGTTPSQGGSSGASGSPSGGMPTGGAPVGGTTTSAGAGGGSAGATTVAGSPSAGASGTMTVAGATSVAGSKSLAGSAGAGVGGAAGGVAGSAGLSGGGVAGAGVAGGSGVAGAGAVPGWKCPASSYGTGDGCDCGCGVVDQDCIDAATPWGTNDGNTALWCQTYLLPGSCVPLATAEAVSAILSGDNSKCSIAPAGWTCALSFYADGTCDCGCGVVDSDCSSAASCDSASRVGACSMNDDYTVISSSNRGLCSKSVPAGWTCSLKAYGDGRCDYGCGIADVTSDCPTGATPYCNSAGACSRDTTVACSAISTSDHTKCEAGTWTCDPARRTDDVCDCGCGAPDPYCVTSLRKECGTCGSPGSCARSCADINPLDNTQCN